MRGARPRGDQARALARALAARARVRRHAACDARDDRSLARRRRRARAARRGGSGVRRRRPACRACRRGRVRRRVRSRSGHRRPRRRRARRRREDRRGARDGARRPRRRRAHRELRRLTRARLAVSWALANTRGFRGVTQGTHVSRAAAPVALDGANKRIGHYGTAARGWDAAESAHGGRAARGAPRARAPGRAQAGDDARPGDLRARRRGGGARRRVRGDSALRTSRLATRGSPTAPATASATSA